MKDKKAKQVKVYRWMGVPNLLEFADVYSVEKKVATYIESILPRINMEDISGWELTLSINYFVSF